MHRSFLLSAKQIFAVDGAGCCCQITLSDIERSEQFMNEQNENCVHPITMSFRQGRTHHIRNEEDEKGVPFSMATKHIQKGLYRMASIG